MMNKKLRLLIVLSLCLVSVMVLANCNGSSSSTDPSPVLVDRNVTVGGGGGSAEVSFSVSSGQTIRITLTASSNMDPYGHLTYPNGTEEGTPPNGMSQNGVNTSEVAVNQTGTCTLTIFDGTNQGGAVHVKVEVI